MRLGRFDRVGLALWLALTPAAPHSGDNAPLLRCRPAESRPVVDGRLDEECWQRADIATAFTLLEARGRATQQTECMAAYDDDNLYVAFRCREADVRGIRLQCTVHDGPVWLDDCVEAFLDPRHGHRDYFHLIANRAGVRFEEIGPFFPNPASWDGPWTVATGSVANGWTVEMAIPFRALGLSVPRPGTIWGFNAHRQEYRLLERSSWSATLHSFHEPAHFGHLQFVSPV